MRNRFLLRVTVVALTACMASAVMLVSAQAPGYQAPRAPDGKPNLNGIWQAINTANWDIEAHAAAPSPVLELGAAGAIPGGLGVVEGGRFRINPEALAKRNENRANRLKLDPEVKCYLARRAARDLHAVPVSDHPESEARHAHSRVCGRGAHDLHDATR